MLFNLWIFILPRVELYPVSVFNDKLIKVLISRLLEVDWLKNIWRPDSFFKNAKAVTFQTMTIPNHYMWLYKDKTILYMVKYDMYHGTKTIIFRDGWILFSDPSLRSICILRSYFESNLLFLEFNTRCTRLRSKRCRLQPTQPRI